MQDPPQYNCIMFKSHQYGFRLEQLHIQNCKLLSNPWLRMPLYSKGVNGKLEFHVFMVVVTMMSMRMMISIHLNTSQ